MAYKTSYSAEVEPQDIDFTLRETIASIGDKILNVAGVDAHSKGFGVDALGHDNLTWVLSRIAIELDYRPPQYTKYDITTWVNEFNRIMTTRNFTLTDAEGRVFGRAVSQWCVLDLKTRTAVDMNTLSDIYDSCLVDIPSPTKRPAKVAPPTGDVRMAEHRVVYSDIDFNRHVNTMRYIQLMLDMLPIEEFERQEALRLDINFLHEARYGQTLIVAYGETGGEWRFEVKTDDATVCVRASLRL